MRLAQRFGKNDRAINEIRHGEGRGRKKGHAMPQFPQQTAQHRADHKADAKCRADQTKKPGPRLWRRQICNGRLGRRIGGAENARHEPPDIQPGQGRREGKDQEINRKAEKRPQKNRPPPKSVGQIARQWPTDKLGDRIKQRQAAPIAVASDKSAWPRSITSCGITGVMMPKPIALIKMVPRRKRTAGGMADGLVAVLVTRSLPYGHWP